ncbi:universal stress protein [Hoyosella sp. YIM 151337]|uniref:universal stress protein n=1 Tax=Hoyosella sp. YIM 151337 TaxID=2992742 RepID=UPI00223605A9|nr:universal stress protein [Hoyosella sp. YIM 151337]MCW4352928.1 universal stress protein [Hoyosella sp. YIM 151337]
MNENLPVTAGVDGSEESYAAVRWAAREALVTNRRLVLLSVAGGYLSTWMPASYFEDIERDSWAALERAERVARDEIGESTSLDIGKQLTKGPLVRELVHASERAHKLVVGARGGNESGLPRVIGSTAAGLAAHAACPLAIIPLHAEYATANRIAVGIDGKRRSDNAIGVAFEEASARGAELVAVYTWEEAGFSSALAGHDFPWDEARIAEEIILAEALAGWSEKFPDVDVSRTVVSDNAARTLAKLSATVDLVIVGSSGRGGFMGLILGSTSIALLDTAQSPLLIVH